MVKHSENDFITPWVVTNRTLKYRSVMTLQSINNRITRFHVQLIIDVIMQSFGKLETAEPQWTRLPGPKEEKLPVCNQFLLGSLVPHVIGTHFGTIISTCVF